MKGFLYCFTQCTWGFLQTLVGFVVFLLNIRCKHYIYHGAVITEWNNSASVSLGLFVFVTKDPYFTHSLRGRFTKDDLARRLLVHEYGNTIQSLFFGPLYLLVMGIPSSYWGNSPLCAKKRRTQNLSYFSFVTEKWANHLGEKVTGEKSMEYIDAP